MISPTEHENADFVMPAWMAGIQIRKDAPETSMSIWIPALYAGMTESRGSAWTDRGPSVRPVFAKESSRIRWRDDYCEFMRTAIGLASAAAHGLLPLLGVRK